MFLEVFTHEKYTIKDDTSELSGNQCASLLTLYVTTPLFCNSGFHELEI